VQRKRTHIMWVYSNITHYFPLDEGASIASSQTLHVRPFDA
jgi:hypothetical protein